MRCFSLRAPRASQPFGACGDLEENAPLEYKPTRSLISHYRYLVDFYFRLSDVHSPGTLLDSRPDGPFHATRCF